MLDADALNCLAKYSIGGIDKTPELYRRDAPLILTPHHKELSRLIGDDPVTDLGTAIEASRRLLWAAGSEDMIVVAKGPSTAVAGVEKVLLPMAGPASLATAGSGDVLAGIIAGSVAQTHNYAGPWELLCAYAVTVHSFTGFAAASRFGEKSVIATDLIDLIGDAMELAAESALHDLGVLDEGSQVEEA